MSLFNPRWLRNFIRRHTNQIPEQRAHVWKQRLSIFYMLTAWNAFGFVLYQVYQGNADWARKYKSEEELSLSPAQQWARTLGIKDAKVIQVSGLQVTNYDIHNEFDEASEAIQE
ncbi:uncharacterized protein LOC659596 [Tribolium castaneum]|uniref:Uncharacterized protein n=1 Tax=Tribolium castaneum TaxID=7070 RepID=D6WT01_TRICA|nr:PREDICTED: uncharacterized protein LOC659596 [Tribolium castaneum]EFA06680.1 hypothetical protein TcasGA2_TC009610 [Tribolium castaneum]|eukprot:XP_970981.1 PREDICTED: uncharacterized protein LOC659596 [Tribolium castaneum]